MIRLDCVYRRVYEVTNERVSRTEERHFELELLSLRRQGRRAEW